MLPKKREVVARYSMLDPNGDVRNDVQKEYTVGTIITCVGIANGYRLMWVTS